MNKYENSFSKEETTYLLNLITHSLQDINYRIENIKTDSNILWHFTIPVSSIWEFRDNAWDRWEVHRNYLNCSIEAWINPNGVWDWKLPEIAMTYSINCTWSWYVTPYRHKNWHNADYKKFYWYSRNAEELVKSFQNFLYNDLYYNLK